MLPTTSGGKPAKKEELSKDMPISGLYRKWKSWNERNRAKAQNTGNTKYSSPSKEAAQRAAKRRAKGKSTYPKTRKPKVDKPKADKPKSKPKSKVVATHRGEYAFTKKTAARRIKKKRSGYKGKYFGPDEFKGNESAIARWKAAGKPRTKSGKPKVKV